MFIFYPNHLVVRLWSYGSFLFNCSGTLGAGGAGTIYPSHLGVRRWPYGGFTHSLVAKLGVLVVGLGRRKARDEAEIEISSCEP